MKDDIDTAVQRIAPYVHRTPVLTCKAINAMAETNIYFKCENLQKVGAFKFRGACNTVFSLTDEEASKAPFYRPGKDSEEIKYLMERRQIDMDLS